MLNWFKNLSTPKKAAVIIAALVVLYLIVSYFYNRNKKNTALENAIAKAKRAQGLNKWSGRPTQQADWDRINGALRDILGKNDVTDLDNSMAFGFLKGLNLSWENIMFFRSEIADYIAAGGDGDEFVTAGQYL